MRIFSLPQFFLTTFHNCNHFFLSHDKFYLKKETYYDRQTLNDICVINGYYYFNVIGWTSLNDLKEEDGEKKLEHWTQFFIHIPITSIASFIYLHNLLRDDELCRIRWIMMGKRCFNHTNCLTLNNSLTHSLICV